MAFLQAKLEKNKKQQARSNRGLKIFMVIFTIGYLFFFSSRYYMPQVYKSVEIAPIGSVLDLGDYKLTLDSWDYAKEDKAFEILFDVEDTSLNRQPEYTFTCRNGEDLYKSKLYRETNDLLVVRIYKVSPRFAQVSLTVKVGGESKKIYIDDKSMTAVGTLIERSDTEYAVHACQSRIAGQEAAIQELEQQKIEKNADMEYNYSKIEELNKKMVGQSSELQMENKKALNKLAERQTQLQNDLESLMLQQSEMEAQVEIQKTLLVQLQGGVQE